MLRIIPYLDESSKEKQLVFYVVFVQLIVLGLGVYYIVKANAILNSSDTSIDFLSQITKTWQVQPFIEITETSSAWVHALRTPNLPCQQNSVANETLSYLKD